MIRSMFFKEVESSAALEQELKSVKSDFVNLLNRVSNPDIIPKLSGYTQHGFMRSANVSASNVETTHESLPESLP